MSNGSISIFPPYLASPKHVAPSAAARTKLLLGGTILPTLLRLAAPNILNLLAFAGVITFDGFFLGRIGTKALGGASLAFPWVMLVLQTTNSGMGTGVSSAQGAVTVPTISSSTHFCWRSRSRRSSQPVMLLGAPFMFRWMRGREEMLSDALSYASVALGGAVCIGAPAPSEASGVETRHPFSAEQQNSHLRRSIR